MKDIPESFIIWELHITELGDFTNQEHYCVNSLEIEKNLYGESSPLIIKTCNLLALSYLGLQEYEKSLEYSKMALNIAGNNPESVDITDLTGNLQ